MASATGSNKIHIIVNPLSAGGKTEKRWHTIKDLIQHYFKEFKYVFTEKPKQATEITKELLKDGFDLIIGVGGDGILNEITNGFFKKNTANVINEEASLGMIPSGTGSDFIRFLKIPRDFKKSVALIKNSHIKKMDVGRVTFLNNPDGQNVRYFMNVADFGLGAEVIKNLSTIPIKNRNLLCYYKGLLTTIKNYQSRKVKVVLDGQEINVGNKLLIGAIANGGIFGGGMIIAPGAQLDDGYFDVVLVKEMKRLEIIKNSWRLYNGSIIKHPKVIFRRAKNVQIFSDENVNIECDGELGHSLPAEFEVLEQRIKFRI